MKGLYWAALGVLVLGLIFWGVGFGIQANDDALLAVAESADGVLTIERAERVSIAYEAQGTSYQTAYPFYFSAMHTGEAVTVLYDPSDPARITTPYTRRFTSIFQIIGLSIAGAGLLVALIGFLKRQADCSLLENGKRLEAHVTGVSYNTAVCMTGRGNPCRIFAEYIDPDTGEQFEFHSQNLWGDPKKMTGLETVEVSVNELNYKRYAMDVPEEFTKFDRDRLHQPIRQRKEDRYDDR